MDLPLELQSALARCSRRQPAPDAQPDGSINIIRVPYTSIHAVHDSQTFIQTSLEAKLPAQVQQGIPPYGRFDIVNFPGLSREPAICTFPFLLSDKRRRWWGVIPYGRHWAIGVYVHPYHDAYLKMEKLDILSRVFAAPIHENPKIWVGDLLRSVEKKQGKIYSLNGFIDQEIIEPIVAQFPEDPTIETTYRNRFDVIKPDQDNPDERVLHVICAERDIGERHVVLVDLAVAQEAEDDSARMPDVLKNHRLFRIRHGLDIPVGIGFTLQAIHPLVTKRRWHELVHGVIKVLEPAAEDLARIGIELDKTLATAPRPHD